MTDKNKQIKRAEIEKRVDGLARVLQILALIVAAGLTWLDFTTADRTLPVWVIPSILGIAAGLSPEQVKEIIVDVVKTFINKGGGKQ